MSLFHFVSQSGFVWVVCLFTPPQLYFFLENTCETYVLNAFV